MEEKHETLRSQVTTTAESISQMRQNGFTSIADVFDEIRTLILSNDLTDTERESFQLLQDDSLRKFLLERGFAENEDEAFKQELLFKFAFALGNETVLKFFDDFQEEIQDGNEE